MSAEVEERTLLPVITSMPELRAAAHGLRERLVAFARDEGERRRDLRRERLSGHKPARADVAEDVRIYVSNAEVCSSLADAFRAMAEEWRAQAGEEARDVGHRSQATDLYTLQVPDRDGMRLTVRQKHESRVTVNPDLVGAYLAERAVRRDIGPGGGLDPQQATILAQGLRRGVEWAVGELTRFARHEWRVTALEAEVKREMEEGQDQLAGVMERAFTRTRVPGSGWEVTRDEWPKGRTRG